MSTLFSHLNRILLCCLFLSVSASSLLAQQKISVSAGIGIPDLIHLSPRYQSGAHDIGAGIGYIPLGDDDYVFSLTADYANHFGQVSELSGISPWFWKTGLSYLKDKSSDFTHTYLHLNNRIGRELNLSPEFGLKLEAGLLIQLYHDEEPNNSGDEWVNLDIEFPILPSLAFSVFYRF